MSEEQQPKKYPKNYYLNPDEFRNCMLESIEQDKLTNKSVEHIMLMISHVGGPFKYKNEALRQDVYSECLAHLVKIFRKYDVERSANCFAWFTRCTYNGLYAAFNKLHKTGVIMIPIGKLIDGENHQQY